MSSDGGNWTLVTPDGGFEPRFKHTTTSYEGLIWLVGGNNNKTNLNDIWNSSNGKDWTQVMENKQAPF